jgi:hypothetical protein
VNTQLLIDAVMRQTTILVAQLATARGARTPLPGIAAQVFSDLAKELQRQGVSRKVAADMFGLALRTYRRKVQRFAESETTPGRSLWEAVHEFLSEHPVANHAEILERFARDDEETVRGVLQDLVDSGLVFRAGRGASSSYRVATPSDLEHARAPERDTESTDMLVWAVVYRLGPIEEKHLSARVALPPGELEASLARLVAAGRVERAQSKGNTTYRADAFLAPLGETHGWEAAVFDHFQAVVTTICQKLTTATAPTNADRVGGSTYTFEVWPGHPLEAEVFGQLAEFRAKLGGLRDRVLTHNRSTTVPRRRTKAVVYGGQSVLEEDDDDASSTSRE